MQRKLLIFWLLYALLIISFFLKPIVVGWDPSEYLAYGKSIFSNYGYVSNYRPPIWPIILGALWRIGLPMPFTMKALAFLIFAAIPLVPFFKFKDSRKYLGLIIATHPIFFAHSHMPLSHILAMLFFVLAYSLSGILGGVFSAFSGLTRFTYFLQIPFICWKDKKKWIGALLTLTVYFSVIWILFGSPFFQMRAASTLINNSYIDFWEKEPTFYLTVLFATPLLLLALFSKSRFTLGFLAALIYFTLLPHKEERFFIDVLPYIAIVISEKWNRFAISERLHEIVLILIIIMNLFLVQSVFSFNAIPEEAFSQIPEGASVVGMDPEVNAYKNIHFYIWFYYGADFNKSAEYCVYNEWGIPCADEYCESRKEEFFNMCQPIYTVNPGYFVGKTVNES